MLRKVVASANGEIFKGFAISKNMRIFAPINCQTKKQTKMNTKKIKNYTLMVRDTDGNWVEVVTRKSKKLILDWMEESRIDTPDGWYIRKNY